MQASQEIREKLVLVIRNLICRCMEEAGKIPYILDQEEVVDLLVRDPARFEKLVQDEHFERTEYSGANLTAKIDAIAELRQFEALNAFDMSFSSRHESDADLAPILDQVNQLTRTFIVYIGNAATIFERAFEQFLDRFRGTSQRAGMPLRSITLNPGDVAGLERSAQDYLAAGQFLQAFLIERLFRTHVIAKQVVSLPSDYSLCENLIRNALKDAVLFPRLVKFILRAAYISQGGWEDLFAIIVALAIQEPERCSRSLLIDQIEQDAIFSCNLLCQSFASLKLLPPMVRRSAIEKGLEKYDRGPGSSGVG